MLYQREKMKEKKKEFAAHKTRFCNFIESERYAEKRLIYFDAHRK